MVNPIKDTKIRNELLGIAAWVESRALADSNSDSPEVVQNTIHLETAHTCIRLALGRDFVDMDNYIGNIPRLSLSEVRWVLGEIACAFDGNNPLLENYDVYGLLGAACDSLTVLETKV